MRAQNLYLSVLRIYIIMDTLNYKRPFRKENQNEEKMIFLRSLTKCQLLRNKMQKKKSRGKTRLRELRLRNLPVLKSARKEAVLGEITLWAVNAVWPQLAASPGTDALCFIVLPFATQKSVCSPTCPGRPQPWDLNSHRNVSCQVQMSASRGLSLSPPVLHLCIAVKRPCPGQSTSPSKIRDHGANTTRT